MSAPSTDVCRPTEEPIRVLLADDTALFRRAIATLVDEQHDLTVVGQSDNGLDAVRQAETLRPDVVLIDVDLPALDGLAAAGLIRQKVPEARVVMLTCCERDEPLFRAVRLGVHGYLLKDLRPEQLFEMIRSVMRGETPISPALVTVLLNALRRQENLPQSANSSPSPLSPREREILRLVAAGLSNKAIGRRLSITEGTVKNHVHNALRKLNMDNRIQAAAYVVRNGFDPADHRPEEVGQPVG